MCASRSNTESRKCNYCGTYATGFVVWEQSVLSACSEVTALAASIRMLRLRL